MTDEKIISALDAAAAIIHTDMPRVKACRADLTVVALGAVARARHLLYMVDECKKFLKNSQREKVMRWLGFIQGTLWTMGLSNIETLKEANKPDDAPGT